MVPGVGDIAQIVAPSSTAYTVLLKTKVNVSAVLLNQQIATLAVSGTFTSPNIDLRHGILELERGTLSGVVTEQGAKVILRDDDVLDNVTWKGKLDPRYLRGNHAGTLTISNGLKLTGANGSGPGTATLDGPTVFSGLSTLG